MASPVLREYLLLMRVDKPIGTYLLLWPTYWALWIAAQGIPDLKILLIFTAGVFLMRSAGCVINDIFDAGFDKHVKRTSQRPLASERISRSKAILLFVFLVALAFLLVLLTNRLTIYLSLAAVVLAVTYPLMKRIMWFPQVVLGAAFSMAIPMAFAAQTGEVPQLAWLLFLANLLWVTAYDTEYAMVDREDDLEIGIRSTAILFGDLDRFAIALLQAMFLLSMFLLGRRINAEPVYFLSLLLALLLFLRQLRWIQGRDAEPCFRAFLDNGRVGAIIFAGLLLNYWCDCQGPL